MYRYGGPQADLSYGAAAEVTSAGRWHIIGSFLGPITVGTTSLIPVGNSDVVTLAFDLDPVPALTCPSFSTPSAPRLTLTATNTTFTRLSTTLVPIGLQISASDPDCPGSNLQVQIAVLRYCRASVNQKAYMALVDEKDHYERYLLNFTRDTAFTIPSQSSSKQLTI